MAVPAPDPHNGPADATHGSALRARAVLRGLEDARRQGRRLLGILIDPDRQEPAEAARRALAAQRAGAHLLLVGGSLLTEPTLEPTVLAIKAAAPHLPVVLFPGSIQQVTGAADALLFLSLISGRNPELLIGAHVVAAPLVRASGLEVLPTGYMLVDGGRPTTVSYMSHTMPLPSDKPGIAACTALAGELLGLRLMYLDAGSGAARPVPPAVIAAVAAAVQAPIVVGGGIRTAEAAQAAWAAGATLVIVGNALEEAPERVGEFAQAMGH